MITTTVHDCDQAASSILYALHIILSCSLLHHSDHMPTAMSIKKKLIEVNNAFIVHTPFLRECLGVRFWGGREGRTNFLNLNLESYVVFVNINKRVGY